MDENKIVEYCVAATKDYYTHTHTHTGKNSKAKTESARKSCIQLLCMQNAMERYRKNKNKRRSYYF